MKLCPECDVELVEKDVDGILIDCCFTCRGYFFDSKELEDASKNTKSQKIMSTSSKIQVDTKRRVRKCPKCTFVMSIKKMGEIEIDRCMSCVGVWLDGGEFAKVSELINSRMKRGGIVGDSEETGDENDFAAKGILGIREYDTPAESGTCGFWAYLNHLYFK